eukprot:CAMPEP_0113730214 /NCGR_PEP_ID=MMETSP0038_2-20120614/43032_1 /TAXON_ID=2898 /ORGANISM="Cryptomonas paramecium" /LENGTH=227 /DNA_ID=CAMNT_0000662245 /DNA_START=1185 /DNA_END=1868 /DNA_ORIENTATION=- /assembly_acc=CAM_ASM_000170
MLHTRCDLKWMNGKPVQGGTGLQPVSAQVQVRVRVTPTRPPTEILDDLARARIAAGKGRQGKGGMQPDDEDGIIDAGLREAVRQADTESVRELLASRSGRRQRLRQDDVCRGRAFLRRQAAAEAAERAGQTRSRMIARPFELFDSNGNIIASTAGQLDNDRSDDDGHDEGLDKEHIEPSLFVFKIVKCLSLRLDRKLIKIHGMGDWNGTAYTPPHPSSFSSNPYNSE